MYLQIPWRNNDVNIKGDLDFAVHKRNAAVVSESIYVHAFSHPRFSWGWQIKTNWNEEKGFDFQVAYTT